MAIQDDSIQEFINSHPEVREIFDNYCELQKLEHRIKTVNDLRKQVNMLRRYQVLSKINYEGTVNMLIDELNEAGSALSKSNQTIKRVNEVNSELANQLKEERQDHDAFYKNLCSALTVNPRETFEFILRQIEREEKTDCQDGQKNLSWILRFGLPARLSMAWKLVFGKKSIL